MPRNILEEIIEPPAFINGGKWPAALRQVELDEAQKMLLAQFTADRAFPFPPAVPIRTNIKRIVPDELPIPPIPKDTSKVTVNSLYKYKPLSKYIGLMGNTSVRAGTTFIGVEIELEKVDLRSKIVNTWAMVTDNSLKDNGQEFVTIPIQFKYLEVELQRLFDGVKTCKASSRCSVHVHINARDFTLKELKTFMALYMVFEKSLYNYSGNRWNNNFCVPLTFYPDEVVNFLDGLDEGYIRENWHKYFGLNISPIFGGESTKIGTIEFRHMVGTTDIPYILNWINLIVSLKITAKKMPYVELADHLKNMNTTSSYYWLAEQVFREYRSLITGQPTFKEDVEFCVTRTKQNLRLNDLTVENELIPIIRKGTVLCVD